MSLLVFGQLQINYTRRILCMWTNITSNIIIIIGFPSAFQHASYYQKETKSLSIRMQDEDGEVYVFWILWFLSEKYMIISYIFSDCFYCCFVWRRMDGWMCRWKPDQDLPSSLRSTKYLDRKVKVYKYK